MKSIFLTRHSDINNRVAALRSQKIVKPLKPGGKFFSDISLHQDVEQNRDIEATSPEGEVLRIKASANEESRWTSIHFPLGAFDLTDVEILGVAIKSRSHMGAAATRVCLRSGNQGEFRDFFFDKYLVSTAQRGAHLDVCDLETTRELPRTAKWRDLVLFFPSEAIDLSIENVKVFSV